MAAPSPFTASAGSGTTERLYGISHSLLLAQTSHMRRDDRFHSIPWGEAAGDENLSAITWCGRDMVNSATSLLATGNITPLRALIYLACSQRQYFHQNF
jgi:hypothetical protein